MSPMRIVSFDSTVWDIFLPTDGAVAKLYQRNSSRAVINVLHIYCIKNRKINVMSKLRLKNYNNVYNDGINKSSG